MSLPPVTSYYGDHLSPTDKVKVRRSHSSHTNRESRETGFGENRPQQTTSLSSNETHSYYAIADPYQMSDLKKFYTLEQT